jgi:ribonuclease D
MHIPITTADALHARLHPLAAQPVIGLDTEFLRERTYYAQLCLLQLSGADDAFCVDTIALAAAHQDDGTALAPLRALMAESRVCKVLHAARQDREVLLPTCGPLLNVFDTQLAAALCGFAPQVGYAALVEALLQVTLHKSQTRTDWSRRPLSTAQIEYAIDDVRHLLPLRELLLERLGSLGRLAWFEEDSRAEELAPLQVDPAEAWLRVKGLSDLDEPRLRLAQRLGAWREERAMKSDRPRGWILPDLSLREIVMRVPRTPSALGQVPELTDGMLKHSGASLLQIVGECGIPEPPAPLPRRDRPPPEQQDRVKALAAITRRRAEELQLAPELLAPRRELERLANGAREGGVFSGWRREVVGTELLAAL